LAQIALSDDRQAALDVIAELATLLTSCAAKLRNKSLGVSSA